MEKVSVIVPIYNAGEYLRPCLESIVNQTYLNLEIILINDGSTDTSAAICEEFRQIDSRIRVIHRKLGGSGVGAARNAALPLVTGDFILFVDNDDWLELNQIEILYKDLKNAGSDIAVANFTEFFEERQSFAFHVDASDPYLEIYTPQEWFEKQYDGRLSFSQCFTVPWGKLYKAELFQDIVYPEEEKVEDDLTTWKVYLMADRISYRNLGLYYHRKRPTSVTSVVEIEHVFPIKSIEERVTILSLIGFDISNELRAYRWRLEKHKDSYISRGDAYNYKKCLQKLKMIEKYR